MAALFEWFVIWMEKSGKCNSQTGIVVDITCIFAVVIAWKANYWLLCLLTLGSDLPVSLTLI